MTNRTPETPNEIPETLAKIARIIEPRAWGFYDAAIGPYARNTGAREGEQFCYGITWRRGCRSVADVERWLFDDDTDAVTPMFIFEIRESLTKAASILALTAAHAHFAPLIAEAYLRGLREAMAALERERLDAVANGTSQAALGVVWAKKAIQSIITAAEPNS